MSLLLYRPEEKLVYQYFFIIRLLQSQGLQTKKIGGLSRKILWNPKAYISLNVIHWRNALNLSACIFSKYKLATVLVPVSCLSS